ncbi:MAG: hypothetical protein ABSA44_09690 [Bacteroidota bacterium]|jgi:ABC-type hemin transport system substrate-binding protein
MAISHSKAEFSAEYSSQASVVANACREIIQTIAGLTLKEFSPQTGMISARASLFSYPANREIILKITKSGEGTIVSGTATAGEGLITSGGAQKLITEFFNKLSSHKALEGKSKSGW